MKVHLGIAAGTLLGLVTAGVSAFGFPIARSGTECLPIIVAGSDPIKATYQGNSAAFSNDLYLMLDASGQPGDDGNPANDRFIFNNQTSPVGSMVMLGSFPIGTELLFRLHVNNTGNNFFSGAVGQNPDGHCHARAQANWQPGETLVSFEDLRGGPFDYNDLSFSFTNTTASEITLSPASATNPVGTMHTLTATIRRLGVPQAGIVVAFSIISGPNAGAAGTCAANANCATDASGQVSFTYADSGGAGTDRITACFTDTSGPQCSQPVTKIWSPTAGCGPDETPCDDGNACTTDDLCSNGSCVGEPIVCGPLDQCHAASVCDPETGLCPKLQAVPDGYPCNDDNGCSVHDACSRGSCVGQPRVCAPLDQCHTAGVCDRATARCSNPAAPAGITCAAGDLCTLGQCDGKGTCVPVEVVDCFPDPCNRSVCGPLPGTCHLEPLPDGTACDDGHTCTPTDECRHGTCVGGPLPCPCPACDDGDPCTLDTCVDGGQGPGDVHPDDRGDANTVAADGAQAGSPALRGAADIRLRSKPKHHADDHADDHGDDDGAPHCVHTPDPTCGQLPRSHPIATRPGVITDN